MQPSDILVRIVGTRLPANSHFAPHHKLRAALGGVCDANEQRQSRKGSPRIDHGRGATQEVMRTFDKESTTGVAERYGIKLSFDGLFQIPLRVVASAHNVVAAFVSQLKPPLG
jgi:hypothetical protein